MFLTSVTLEVSTSQAKTAFTKQNDNQLGIYVQPATASELTALKSRVGVAEEDQNYTQLIVGHGTGYRPPTEKEWSSMAGNLNLVTQVIAKTSLSSSIDLSSTIWFPEIGDQEQQGSCVAWCVGYYIKTFQEAHEHNWDVSSASWVYSSPDYVLDKSHQSEIMSPAFIYNLAANGIDQGTSFDRGIGIICNNGVCSWANMPYAQNDYVSWPSEKAWIEAQLYRGNGNIQYLDLTTDSDLNNLKNLLNQYQPVGIAVDANKFSGFTSNDVLTTSNYVNPSENHANTVVGYDDNFAYTEGGTTHYGAFKIANSWGIGNGWEHVVDGFYWISYAAMKQSVQEGYLFSDKVNYEPELLASFSMSGVKTGDASFIVGLGDANAPLATINFNSFISGSNTYSYANKIYLDVTEFKNYVSSIYNQQYYLQAHNWGSIGATVTSFAVEYADYPSVPAVVGGGRTICLNLTLPSFTTSWANPETTNSDKDKIDLKAATASDKSGNLYTAYCDLYSETGKTALFIDKSTDDGLSWSRLKVGTNPSNLWNPALAIDPYSGDIYVGVEVEYSSRDHDIFVYQCIDGLWSWIQIAASGYDEIMPSITSEYLYGSNNRQYICFEYCTDTNDRDLMLAKTVNHGASWTTTKLLGGSDNNVYSQTSITNAEGNIYIAYRYSTDYSATGDIRLGFSSDFGSTWAQISNIDGFNYDCQLPSIAATHGGDVLMVAFQYQASSTNQDIYYSYSSNNGATWTKQQPLFASNLQNEKAPVLTVDGAGTVNPSVSGNIHAFCQYGRYVEYKFASSSQPTSWSANKLVNNQWSGDRISAGTRLVNGVFCPFAVWSDSRTKDLYFSDSGYPVTFTYTISGSGSPSVPSVTYSYLGTNTTMTANPAETVMVDGGSSYNYTNPLPDSNSTQRYSSINSAGTVWAPATVNPIYTCQFFLNVLSQYGNPIGQGWYDEGSTTVFTVSNPIEANSTTRYALSGWNGIGAGAYSGSLDTGIVVMNNALVEVAEWKVQYKVTFTAIPSGSASIIPVGETWQNQSEPLSIEASPNSGNSFLNWTVTGNISVDAPTQKSANATINGPGTITAYIDQTAASTSQSSSGGGSKQPSQSPPQSPAPTEATDKPTEHPTKQPKTTKTPDISIVESGLPVSTLAILTCVALAVIIPAAIISFSSGKKNKGYQNYRYRQPPNYPAPPQYPQYLPPQQYFAGPQAQQWFSDYSNPTPNPYESSPYGSPVATVTPCPYCRSPVQGDATSCPTCYRRIR
jgi:hypothetical protein